MNSMPRLILASISERRKQIFSYLGLPFECERHQYKEDNSLPMRPNDLVEYLAFQKVISISHLYEDVLIIGSDTLVEFKGEVYPKPNSKNEAVQMLLELSGSTHHIITGFAILDTKSLRSYKGFQKTEITFKKISSIDAEAYVRKEDVLGVAGAYDHEHLGAIFVEKMSGDFYSSIGFPLFMINESLKENFGIDSLLM